MTGTSWTPPFDPAPASADTSRRYGIVSAIIAAVASCGLGVSMLVSTFYVGCFAMPAVLLTSVVGAVLGREALSTSGPRKGWAHLGFWWNNLLVAATIVTLAGLVLYNPDAFTALLPGSSGGSGSGASSGYG